MYRKNKKILSLPHPNQELHNKLKDLKEPEPPFKIYIPRLSSVIHLNMSED